MTHKWARQLQPLLVGGITLGWLQAGMSIDWNSLWFQFIVTWLSALINALFGADLGSLTGGADLFSGFAGAMGV